MGHKVVAITDHEAVCNAIKVEKYYKKVKEKNPDFKVILGNEIYLCRNGLNAENFDRNQDKYAHFILLARDAIGHKQIREISTRAWNRSYMYRGMRRVPTYYQDLIDIISSNKGHVIGSTACFRAGQQIETSTGWKNIEDIKSGDLVVNRYGEWEKVEEPTTRYFDGIGYEIDLTGNENKLVCTDNHQFLTITANKKIPQWTRADELITKTGGTKHILLLPVNYNYSSTGIIYKKDFVNKLFPTSIYSKKRYELPDKIVITPELMRLFGLFLGDGCISLKSNPNIGFTLNEKEFDSYYNSFIKSIEEQLNIRWTIGKRPAHHRVDISCSSREFIELFYYIFGDVKAGNKFVPDILRINKELDCELIFGYFLADGYFRIRKSGKMVKYKTGEFVSASISHKLTKDIYNILNSIGLSCGVTFSKGRIDKNGVNHKDSWYVNGSNLYLGQIDKEKEYSHKEIVKIFNQAIEYKKKDFITIEGIKYRKIRIKSKNEIELHEQVYCLNNQTHSFKCENVIVHNCLGGTLPTQLLKYRESQDEVLFGKIKSWIVQMDELFGRGNFFFELQPSHNKEQIYVNRQLVDLSKEMDIPYIITTDTHYLKKEDRTIHKAYLNAQNGEREVDDFYATTYLMGTEELESYIELTEEELQVAYRNILAIKDMCEDYSLMKSLKIPQLPWKTPQYLVSPKNYYKDIPWLKTFVESDYSGDKILAQEIVDRIFVDETLQNKETYNEVNSNLKTTWVSSNVNKTHWSAYFLNLQKIIDCCWEAGSLVGCGRGSGVGFILLYILGITQINPLREKTRCYEWRFLNPDRVSVLDVDFDIEGGRRFQVLVYLREVYGSDRVANVATFGTEKSKSAILTAARGLGIDVDVAQYISSLIPADRGQLRSLSQCFYGDEEKGFAPIKQFVTEMTQNYPELWEVAQKIEGLVCRMGIHAGGVIFVDEPFTNSTALMRAPDGTICTQFDLHDCEDVSLIKYDALSVEAMDKIHNCIDLICEYDPTQRRTTLKDTYESLIGVYNLERDDPKMWKMVWDHQIASLFQMEKQSGITGIAVAKPKSVDELAVLNSVIRLMAPEKGAEQPLDMWARYRKDISQWYSEMRRYGLTEDEIEWLANHDAITDGICESQEGLMSLVQEERLGANSLTFADKCRKGLAKKIGSLFDECEKEFYKNIEEKGCSKTLAHYVWDVLLKVQRGYSFNKSHCLAYSIIALQEMNLAYRFPIIFWNCACLISDSGGAEIFKEEEENEEFFEENYDSCVEEFYEETPEDEEEETGKDKKKKKAQTTDYGKIATAIGKMRDQGIIVAPPDINESTLTFSPDVENSIIRYGLNGISKIKKELAREIIDKRPYRGIEDFLSKIKINKPKMINLIKCGAFDKFGNRVEIMRQYVRLAADLKKRVTLQNMKMLCDFDLIPDEYDMERRVYNFNKYLKKLKIGITHYGLDNIAFNFYSQHFDMDLLEVGETESGFMIPQAKWDKIYQHHMDIVRPFVKENSEKLLEEMNNKIMGAFWDKYCQGSISKWEMDSVSFYSHEHELSRVDNRRNGFADFHSLSEEPEINTIIHIKDKQTKQLKPIPLFKIFRIAGVVLDKNKDKKTVTLLTTDGVVMVKIYGDAYSNYDKQISIKGVDGKKRVIEKSWFQRGNKIIVTGIRRGEEFVCKKYARTPWHLVELITEIREDGSLITKGERAKV